MMYRLAIPLALATAACLGEPAAPTETTTADPVTARGSRLLAMAVGAAPGESLDAAVARAKAAGVTTAVLSYDWSALEPAALQYQAAQVAADAAYFSAAPHAMSVVVNVRPIAGPARVLPPDLRGRRWNDPVVTTRFGYLLSFLRIQLAAVDVRVMTIGTELDHALAVSEYPDYKIFFEAARTQAKALWGAALPVGATVTLDGLVTAGPRQAAILDLAEHADRVMMTYYPMNADFRVRDPYQAPIADLYAALYAIDLNAKTRGRPLDLIEVGYPTSAALGSSPAHQQALVATMFALWDAYLPRISSMVFTWEADLSEAGAEWVANGSWSGACQATGTPPAAPGAPALAVVGTGGARTWRYYVVAIGPGGCSLPGAIATLTTGPAALSATSAIRVRWAAVPGATSYQVFRYATGGSPTQTGAIGATAALQLDDPGLAVPAYNFQEFLRTLGYRTATQPVADKPGLTQLATEAHARGW